jgi:BirA family transcriptional regulator, biotin operon repressor / biotin---[acetyl-CoA-carboxylase] ligase
MQTSAGCTNPWEDAPVVVKERVTSTMEEAFELARSGCPTGTVVVSGFQEEGRGRVPGRKWHSAPWESLLATVVVKRSDIGFPLPQLPLRAGVAAALAVEGCAGVKIQIKWPNDLMHAGRKIAGLLCEARGEWALIGLGVNCSQTEFPPELARSACSILQACGRAVPVFTLLESVLGALKATLADDEWRQQLLRRLHGRGGVVVVDLLGSGLSVEGMLQEVDEAGQLVLRRVDGQVLRIAQGEIRPGR